MKNATLFIEHIERFTSPLHADEIVSILSFFTFQTLSKKTNIQEANRPCDVMCFVLHGCLRSYYIKENGTEQTLDFAIEQWWITDLSCF